MTTLDEIQKRYPKAKYAPRPNCKFCDGTGIRTKINSCCICIFVDPDFCDDAAKMISEHARTQLNNLRREANKP